MMIDMFPVALVPAAPGWRALMKYNEEPEVEFPIVAWAVVAERYADPSDDGPRYREPLNDSSRTIEAVIVGGDAVGLESSNAFFPWRLSGYLAPGESR